MFSDQLTQAARDVLAAAQKQKLKLVTAESCTGGLVAACLTSIPGSSAVFERGLVTYSNEAKVELLGVPMALIQTKGAVSEEVARAMAEGALAQTPADIAVAVTGIAGPDGGSAEKPVGLVHFAAARRGSETAHEEHRFGNIGRHVVQAESAGTSLRLLMQMMSP